LKHDYRILIILAQILLTKLAIKLLFKFPPHLMSVSALPRNNRSSKIRVKWTKKVDKFHLSRSVARKSQ